MRAARTVARMDEVEEQPKQRYDWTLNNWGPRALYCVLAGFVINLSTGIHMLGTVITVVLFMLITAIVAVRRR